MWGTRTLVLSAALLSLAPASSWAKGVTLDRIEASVNSSIILLTNVVDFRKSLGLRAQLDPLFGSTPIAKKADKSTDSEVVSFLVDEKLITQEFPVSDSDVEQEINSIQATNQITREALKNALREQNFQFSDYFELIRLSVSKRNLIDREIRTKVHITENDVKNYFYNQYTGASRTSFKYHVKIITVNPANFKSAQDARKAAQDALAAIQGGDAFEEVARRNSDDASAKQGGDLGFLSEDEINPAIRSALSDMKVGQISSVLGNSSGGYFILKLADLRSGQEDKLKKMTDEITNQLTTAEYQRQIALWLDRQRQRAFVRFAGQTSFPN